MIVVVWSSDKEMSWVTIPTILYYSILICQEEWICLSLFLKDKEKIVKGFFSCLSLYLFQQQQQQISTVLWSVYRVSCVVYRVSCIVCRVSCVVCRVSCVVCRVSCVVTRKEREREMWCDFFFLPFKERWTTRDSLASEVKKSPLSFVFSISFYVNISTNGVTV